jgi:hypothetical protein
MFRSFLHATALAVFTPAMSIAASYDLGGVLFETANPQSMWVTGDAGVSVGTEGFDDPAWDVYEAQVAAYKPKHAQYQVDLAAAEERTSEFIIATTAYEVQLLAYQTGLAVCKLTRSCPPEPVKPDILTLHYPTKPIAPSEPGAPPKSLSGTTFVGESWGKDSNQINLGGIIGDPSTAIPNPALAKYGLDMTAYGVKYAAYQAKLGLWKACPFSCPKKPKKPSEPDQPPLTVNISTETGAEARLSSAGKLGVDLNYQLDSGSVSAQVEYDISAILPDAVDIKAGEAFSINGASVFTDGDIKTQSPTVGVSLDAVLELQVDASARACFIGECDSDGVELVNVETEFEIVRFDTDGIAILADPDPGVFKLPNGLLDVTLGSTAGSDAAFEKTLKYDTGTKKLIVGAGVGEPVVGTLNRLGEFTVNGFPVLELDGSKIGGKLVASGATDKPIVKLNVDLDGLFSLTTSTPPFEAEKKVAGVQLNFQGLDLDVSAALNFYQDFELVPELMVDFMFDKLVEVDGASVMSYRGFWDSLPDFKVFEETTFTPEFSVSSVLKSSSGLQVELGIALEALKASFSFEDLGATIGPLLKAGTTTGGNFGKIGILENQFAFNGFNSFMGDSFVLAPYSSTGAPLTGGGPIPPVPLPASLWLLLSGLGVLSFKRRLQRPLH